MKLRVGFPDLHDNQALLSLTGSLFCISFHRYGCLHNASGEVAILLPDVLQLAFAHMAGPLTWAIVAMRNSLVFHDFDKMTTLMMHASPAMVAW